MAAPPEATTEPDPRPAGGHPAPATGPATSAPATPPPGSAQTPGGTYREHPVVRWLTWPTWAMYSLATVLVGLLLADIYLVDYLISRIPPPGGGTAEVVQAVSAEATALLVAVASIELIVSAHHRAEERAEKERLKKQASAVPIVASDAPGPTGGVSSPPNP